MEIISLTDEYKEKVERIVVETYSGESEGILYEMKIAVHAIRLRLIKNTNDIGADLTAFSGRRLSAFVQVRPTQTKTSPSRLATAHGNTSASTLEP